MANLGLYSFKSRDGLDDSGAPLPKYYFPPVVGQDQRVMHYNAQGSNLQYATHMEGVMLPLGTGPNAPGYGEITTQFDMIPPWLGDNKNPVGGTTYYTSNNLGGNYAIEAALDDFNQRVMGGGLGILVEYYHTGFNNDGSRILSARSSWAFVNGDVTITRSTGGTVVSIQLTLVFPTGKWVMGPDPTDPNVPKRYFY